MELTHVFKVFRLIQTCICLFVPRRSASLLLGERRVKSGTKLAKDFCMNKHKDEFRQELRIMMISLLVYHSDTVTEAQAEIWDVWTSLLQEIISDPRFAKLKVGTL